MYELFRDEMPASTLHPAFDTNNPKKLDGLRREEGHYLSNCTTGQFLAKLDAS